MGRTQRIFERQKVCAVKVDIILYLTKSDRMHSIKVNSNVNYGLWIIKMCHSSMVTPVPFSIIDSREKLCVRGRIYKNFLYFLINFAVNLKLLFKKSLKKEVKPN